MKSCQCIQYDHDRLESATSSSYITTKQHAHTASLITVLLIDYQTERPFPSSPPSSYSFLGICNLLLGTFLNQKIVLGREQGGEVNKVIFIRARSNSLKSIVGRDDGQKDT
jgi:hypothetical protein